jgi:preprotein translocase subunit SecD
MDPLAPTTHTLSPAISHIAETAASLSSSIHSVAARPQGLGIEVRVEDESEENEKRERKKKEQETVRWVLDTPRRLRALVAADKDEEAEKEWNEVSGILDKWGDVRGVKELRLACEEIMQEEESVVSD